MAFKMKMLCMLDCWFTTVCCLTLCYAMFFIPDDFRFGIFKPLLKNKHISPNCRRYTEELPSHRLSLNFFESV